MLEADYTIGGGWGNRIDWSDPSQFEDAKRKAFDVYGWKTNIPKVGQTLLGEFEKSWILFRFTEVHRFRDPHDMFHAVVAPIAQELK